MTKRLFACWLLIEQSQSIHKSCFIVVMFTERMVCNLRRITVLISSPKETHCMRNGRYWWRIPFSRVHCHERLITHNGHQRGVAIVKEIDGIREGRIRVGDRREDRQLLIADCPHWFQFKSNEIPQNRLSLRWVGSANYSWDIAIKG